MYIYVHRKNVQKSAQLPDIDFLNRSISKPKDDNINRETTYMIPIPDEQAPLNPPPFPKLPPLPKFPPPPTRESIESNIYAEPHFYHTISFSDETHEVKHEGEDEPDEGYIHLEDELDSPEVEQDVDLKKPVIVGMTLKQPVKDSDEAT